MEQLLSTKLNIPAVRSKLIHRPRLIERLDLGLHAGGKLSLVSAPAGFGKTTLVSEWIDHLRPGDSLENRTDNKITWLSLDAEDNDYVRFLAYILAALGTIEEGLGEGPLRALQSPQPPPAESILTALINEIGDIPDSLILILDDYHQIEAESIHKALGFLLEHLPPNLHLVIITREDPLIPLSRLRVRGHLTELRAADLRFTSAEAAEFLDQVMGLELSTQDIAALETRTEGWIAGLQLAAISLQGQSNATQLIQSFTGSNRLVMDYLIEEVLERQPEPVQRFLLHTAILERLSGPLCNALTGQEDGQATLERLDQANMFVLPLDHERRWYRYHHLFADLLRWRLRQSNPDQVPGLHLQASQWYEANGFADEAIAHALLADDYARGAALIADAADPLWERGEHIRLRTWLGKLPDEWMCGSPNLCIYHAWFLFSTGHLQASERYLLAAEQALAASPHQTAGAAAGQPISQSYPERRHMEGRLNAVRALIASWGDDFPEIIRHARLALERLPVGDPWRRMAELALGDAYFYNGDMQEAYQTRLETLAACQAEDDLFFYMIANLKVATSLREMGRLNETIEICRRQLDFAQQYKLTQTIFAGWALGLMGVALAEQNELPKALEYTTQSVQLTKGSDLAFVGFSHMVLARTQFYLGEFTAAEATLQALAEIDRRQYLPHWITGSMTAWLARVYLAQGRDEAALRLVEQGGQNIENKSAIIYDNECVALARIYLAQGRVVEAEGLLARLYALAQPEQYTARLIEILSLQALVYQALDDTPRALDKLAHALTLAEPGGYIRVFVDEGPPMARLLFESLSQAPPLQYARRLLGAFPDPQSRPQTPSPAPEDELIEPLSERELDVLKLVAQGLSNPEIAGHLYLSLNTVKAHTRNIYGKLGVKNRTQASARARALGLLELD